MGTRLNFSTKFAYGIGQAAEGLKNTALGAFVLFYYNQVLGLPGTLAGLALAIALVCDAFTDPLAGSLSDNLRSRYGRRHPFMYASALPLAVTFYLLFVPPAGLSDSALFIWLTVTVVATRLAMTLYHVPHIALGAELSEDYQERTRIVSFRYVLGTLGSLAAYALGFGYFFQDTPAFARGQFNVEAYGPYALTLSVLMVVTILWSGVGTHHRIPYLPEVRSSQGRLSFAGVIARMFREVLGALKNHSFAWLFTGVLVIYMMVGVDNSLNLYLFEFFWELGSREKMWLLILYLVGIMLGSMLTPFLHRYFDKVTGILFGVSWWSLCQVVPILLRFHGWFPDNDTDLLAPTLIVIRFFQGVGVAQALVSFNSLIADIADEHELDTRKRQEGIFFAAASFSAKATSGIGTLMAGIALDIINWPRGPHIQTADDVPVQALADLGMLYGPVVAGFAVVSVFCAAQCRMTREKHATIVRQLQEARQIYAGGPALPRAGPSGVDR